MKGNAENKDGNARNGMGMRVLGISVGMREIWVEMQTMVGNQGGDAGNQVGNLSMMVEMTENCNGNDKFKERREVQIVEN